MISDSLCSLPNEIRVLHELGGLLGLFHKPFEPCTVSPDHMASIIENLIEKRITRQTAKNLLLLIINGEHRDVAEIIRQNKLAINYMSDEEYHKIAQRLVKIHPGMADKVKQGDKRKLQWFVGQFMRQADGKVDAQKASDTIRGLFD